MGDRHDGRAARTGAASSGEVGLDFEDVTFPSMDGVALEGWFIPAKSDKLMIHNHLG